MSVKEPTSPPAHYPPPKYHPDGTPKSLTQQRLQLNPKKPPPSLLIGSGVPVPVQRGVTRAPFVLPQRVTVVKSNKKKTSAALPPSLSEGEYEPGYIRSTRSSQAHAVKRDQASLSPVSGQSSKSSAKTATPAPIARAYSSQSVPRQRAPVALQEAVDGAAAKVLRGGGGNRSLSPGLFTEYADTNPPPPSPSDDPSHDFFNLDPRPSRAGSVPVRRVQSSDDSPPRLGASPPPSSESLPATVFESTEEMQARIAAAVEARRKVVADRLMKARKQASATSLPPAEAVASSSSSSSPSVESSNEPRRNSEERKEERKPEGGNWKKRASILAREGLEYTADYNISSQAMQDLMATIAHVRGRRGSQEPDSPPPLLLPEQPEARETSSVEIDPDPQPRLTSDTLTVADINRVFPQGPQSVLPRTYVWEEGEFLLEPVNASARQITHFSLLEEEIGIVRTLKLHKTTITDMQLIALLKRFPQIEAISLWLNPDLKGEETVLSLIKGLSLRSLEIRLCPRMGSLAQLAGMKMDKLVEVSFSTRERIEASDFLRQLANAPQLQMVDFSLCPNLTPEALLCFKTTRNPIQLKVKGCDLIGEETIEELNQDRSEKLDVKRGPAEETVLDQLGLIAGLQPQPARVSGPRPPPAFPEEASILSTSAVAELFSMGRILDGTSMQTQIDEEKEKKFTNAILAYKGLSWSGQMRNDPLACVLAVNSSFERIRLFACEGLSNVDLLELRRQPNIKTLYLGKLPITVKVMEQLFQSTGKPGWQNLQTLYLAGLPVTNKTLHDLAKMPKLQDLDLSYCQGITWQGLQALTQCPKLEKICLSGCDKITPFDVYEFAKARPDVTVEIDPFPFDAKLIEMALAEVATADALFPPKQFSFLGDGLIAENDLEQGLGGYLHDDVATSQAYTERLALFGIGLDHLGIETMSREHWMKADQVLQALRNILRCSHALIAHLTEVGYFTDQDAMKPPKTMEDLTAILGVAHEKIDYKQAETEQGQVDLMAIRQLQTGKMTPSLVHKVQALPFQNLALTRIPRFLWGIKFEQVKNVCLEGNFVSGLPEGMLQNLPALGQGNQNSSARSPRAADPHERKKPAPSKPAPTEKKSWWWPFK